MRLIDSHIHLDFEAFIHKRTELIRSAIDHGIAYFVVPSTTLESFNEISELEQSHQSVLPAYGLHPYFIDTHQERVMPESGV